MAASSGFCQVMKHTLLSDRPLERALGKKGGQARPPSWDFLFEEVITVANNVIGCQHSQEPSDGENCALQELSELVSLTSGSM